MRSRSNWASVIKSDTNNNDRNTCNMHQSRRRRSPPIKQPRPNPPDIEPYYQPPMIPFSSQPPFSDDEQQVIVHSEALQIKFNIGEQKVDFVLFPF